MFKSLITQFTTEAWLFKLVFIFLLAIVIHIVCDYIVNHLKKTAKKSKNIWDDSIISAVSAPLIAIIWVFAIKFGVDIAATQINGEAFYGSNMLLRVAVIVTISWSLLRFVTASTGNMIKVKEKNGEDVDHTTIDALAKLSKLTIAIIAVLVILQSCGISVSGVLAAGGVGGLVVGFAAKDLLANLFGGLTIYMDKPFKVGDWIRCEEKNVEGTVEYIGWRHTRIRAFNKNPIYIPNATFTTVLVENPSRMSHRRIKEVIGIRYCDIAKMDIITQEIRAMLDSHKEVDKNLPSMAYFTSFGASSIDFTINVFISNTEWHSFSKAKHEILLLIAEIIENHGAEIAFPTRTIHMVDADS